MVFKYRFFKKKILWSKASIKIKIILFGATEGGGTPGILGPEGWEVVWEETGTSGCLEVSTLGVSFWGATSWGAGVEAALDPCL